MTDKELLKLVRTKMRQTAKREAFDRADEIAVQAVRSMCNKADKVLMEEARRMVVEELRKNLPAMVKSFVRDIFLTT